MTSPWLFDWKFKVHIVYSGSFWTKAGLAWELDNESEQSTWVDIDIFYGVDNLKEVLNTMPREEVTKNFKIKPMETKSKQN